MADNIFIMQKPVMWSSLNSGISISTKDRGLFNVHMNDILNKGVNHEIVIRIEGEEYSAKLENEKFNEDKFGNHPDIIRIMYRKALAKKLQSVFYHSYEYLCNEKVKHVNKKR